MSSVRNADFFAADRSQCPADVLVSRLSAGHELTAVQELFFGADFIVTRTSVAFKVVPSGLNETIT